MALRFGFIPPELNAKIASASLAEIENWIDWAIDADRLETIFDSHAKLIQQRSQH